MKYLEAYTDFKKWMREKEYDRQLYQIATASEVIHCYWCTEQTKTSLKKHILSKDDFDMLCDYVYHLYLKVTGPMDIALLVAVIKHLLDSRKIKLADIQANKPETEELILEQAIGTED